MKKVLSILVSVALILSCCSIVAFASDTEVPVGALLEGIMNESGESEEQIAQSLLAAGIDQSLFDDPEAKVTTEQMAEIFAALVNDNNVNFSVEAAKNLTGYMVDDGILSPEQKEEVDTAVADAEQTEDPGAGEEGGGSGFDFSKITDILSNLGDGMDMSSFLDGAKSSLGGLLDGIKGIGLPDLSGLAGILSGIPVIGPMIAGLLPGGNTDNSGDNNNTNPGGNNNIAPSNNNNTFPSNSTTIPNTADTAPIAAVGALAVVAGVAFVLTRKKKED